MEPPPELRAAADDRPDVTIAIREYDDETVVSVDFGPVTGEPTLDFVDDTAIVVADGTHLEFDVPPEATAVTVNDGILTVRG